MLRPACLEASTITERLRGQLPRRKAHEANQRLFHAEEAELARAIQIATVAGKPLQPQGVRAIGEAVKGVSENEMVPVEYEPLGKHWLSPFLKKHKISMTGRVEKIDVIRNEVTLEDFEKWFMELKEVIVKDRVLSENIYNMVETG